MAAYILPGRMPVENSTLERAESNMWHFINDLCERMPDDKSEPLYERKPDADRRGRFAFVVFTEMDSTVIHMPGVPLEQVRAHTSWQAALQIASEDLGFGATS